MVDSCSDTGQHRLAEAIKAFENSLKQEDRLLLIGLPKPKAEDVVNLVKDVEERVGKQQKRRLLLENPMFMRFVSSVQQFSSIVDTLVQSNPEIAALVWGGIKFVILGFANSIKYMEEITTMCESMGSLCPQYEEFGKIFSKHPKLQDYICEFYSYVVQFFTSGLEFIYSSAIKQFVRATFQPFQERFGDILKHLSLAKEILDNEIRLCSVKELYIEKVDAAQARNDAKDFYTLARIAHHDYQDDRIQAGEQFKKAKWDRLLQRISNYPYYFEFSNNFSKRAQNSGTWIFDTPGYKRWIESSVSAGFWYHAIPGFGKSVLTAGVIDQILEKSKLTTDDYVVSYFFCSYTNPSSLIARTMILSILQQSLYYSVKVPEDLVTVLESQFEDMRGASHVTIASISDLLVRLFVQSKSKNFIIIDGLDECNDRERGIVLRFLGTVTSLVPERLKILISSRNSEDIRRALNLFEHLDLEDRNQADIESFIDETLKNKEAEGQLPNLSPEVLLRLKKTLSEKAKRLFIWADLQIEEICKESQILNIECILDHLPEDLDKLYERIINRITDRRRSEIARMIFTWVAYSIRPLTLQELKEAVNLSLNPSIRDWATLARMSEADDLKWLQNCENLVSLNRGNRTVSLAHSTVKDFLESTITPSSKFHLQAKVGHKHLGTICIQYFSLPDVNTPPPIAYRTGMSKKNVAALRWLPQMVSQNSSLPNWLKNLVQSYSFGKIYEASEPSPTYTSNAVVKHSNYSGMVYIQRNSFKRLLHERPLLDYATSAWIIHRNDVLYEPRNGDQVRNQSTPIEEDLVADFSDAELKNMLEMVYTRHWSIRFPWQNYLTPNDTPTSEGMTAMLDWALENGVMIIFFLEYRFNYNEKLFKSYDRFWFEGIGKVINHVSTDTKVITRFEIVFENRRSPDQFEKYIFGSRPQHRKLAEAFVKTEPSSPIFWERLMRLELLHEATRENDVSLLRLLVNFIRILPKSANYRSNQGAQVIGMSELSHDDYKSLLLAAIDVDAIDVMEYLQIDVDFETLLTQKDCFHYCPGLNPIQIAAEGNHLEIVQLMVKCSSRRMERIDECGKGYPAIISALRNTNAEMVSALLDGQSDIYEVLISGSWFQNYGSNHFLQLQFVDLFPPGSQEVLKVLTQRAEYDLVAAFERFHRERKAWGSKIQLPDFWKPKTHACLEALRLIDAAIGRQLVQNRSSEMKETLVEMRKEILRASRPLAQSRLSEV